MKKIRKSDSPSLKKFETLRIPEKKGKILHIRLCNMTGQTPQPMQKHDFELNWISEELSNKYETICWTCEKHSPNLFSYWTQNLKLKGQRLENITTFYPLYVALGWSMWAARRTTGWSGVFQKTGRLDKLAVNYYLFQKK